jgi:hypothetical protein
VQDGVNRQHDLLLRVRDREQPARRMGNPHAGTGGVARSEGNVRGTAVWRGGELVRRAAGWTVRARWQPVSSTMRLISNSAGGAARGTRSELCVWGTVADDKVLSLSGRAAWSALCQLRRICILRNRLKLQSLPNSGCFFALVGSNLRTEALKLHACPSKSCEMSREQEDGH